MKTLPLIALIFVLPSLPLPCAARQDASVKDMKHLETTMPSGEPVRFSASDISRIWDTAVVHLKGGVSVKIRETVKAGNRYLVIRADEVSFYEKTGELVPSGNVRITQEDVR